MKEFRTKQSNIQRSEPIGIYVHIPFCAERCAYCDFLTFPHMQKLHEPYVRALLKEIETDAARRGLHGRSADSIFFGGGTPSLLDAGYIEAILNSLRRVVSVSPDAEISLEANPGTLTRPDIQRLRAAGVNRISLGVQTFDDSLLALCRRSHRAADVSEQVALLRREGIQNVNLDMIYAIPGQTLRLLKRDFQAVERLSPEHISWYSLIVEERTLFYRWLREGKIKPVSEDSEEEAFECIRAFLHGAGYERYEVSNFARPGHASRHNLKYWTGKPYWGVGLGAASYLDGERSACVDRFRVFFERVEQGRATWEPEARTAEEDCFERVMMGLRCTAGMDRADFRRRTGRDILSLAPALFQRYRERGHLCWSDRAVWMSDAGLRLQNQFLSDLLYEMERKERRE